MEELNKEEMQKYMTPYKLLSDRAKAVMRFADRVARSPQQAVRYAYGGQRLWSAFDLPKEAIPPCACGATRVFEMQLMPALLLQLNANDLADREPIKQQGKSSATPDNPNTENRTTLFNTADGGKNAIISTTPSATPQRAASTRPDDDDDILGVAQVKEGGKMTGEVKSEGMVGKTQNQPRCPHPVQKSANG
ncbi:unnamed protein product [Pylaiella littoralis]